MSILEARDISKAFGGILALNACSISVAEGEIMDLIGPNGSGKTTLFNVITGYVPPDAGEVRFKDAAITGMQPDKIFGLGIGRTFQLTRIFPRLTVLENMHVAAQRKGWREVLIRWNSTHEQQQALELLEFVGIAQLKNALAGSLSYGQRKLLEFAFILIAAPAVILLDEPSVGLDPQTRKQVFETIALMHRTGRTILMVEQNVRAGLGAATHGVVMESRAGAPGRDEPGNPGQPGDRTPLPGRHAHRRCLTPCRAANPLV